ncbi:hypothetical protein AVEN_74044-1 [Araneus ventricosus]|uniref:Uncharacterized protein n=1 Tax=Araneus ventricosus TaxID=182803 RepID=A0A4Y2J201_ARAVE|nr:hypothetical protein AVEN_74044-1 [Araneus ventricosus]
MFSTLHRRLYEKSSFTVQKADSGRSRTTRTVVAEDNISQEVERNPSISTRVISLNAHIPQSTFWRTVHDEGLHPYHVQCVQALEPGDYNKSIEFARQYLQKCAANRNFAARVLFTDEATFSLDVTLSGRLGQ